MRKRTWVELGIAVLGLFLVCGAKGSLAQDYDTSMSQGSATTDQGTVDTGQTVGSQFSADTGQTAGTQQTTATQQQAELARLRAQVAQLQLQLEQTRVQLARTLEQQAQTAGANNQGVGGSGSAGVEGSGVGSGSSAGPPPETSRGIGRPQEVGNPQDIGGSGDRGTSAQSAPASQPSQAGQPSQADTSNQGVAVANVIHTGRVRSVTPQQLVLADEGGGSNTTLSLARNVQVFRGGRQVSLQSLGEGAMVRTSADLYAKGNPVTRIDVLPPAKR